MRIDRINKSIIVSPPPGLLHGYMISPMILYVYFWWLIFWIKSGAWFVTCSNINLNENIMFEGLKISLNSL